LTLYHKDDTTTTSYNEASIQLIIRDRLDCRMFPTVHLY